MLRFQQCLRKSSQASRRSARTSRAARLELEYLEVRRVMSVSPHGGPVLANVEVEAVYYGQAWAGLSGPQPYLQPGQPPAGGFQAQQQILQLDTFLKDITNSAYLDMLNEYGAGRGTFSGDDLNPTGPAAGTTVTELQIQSMLLREILRGTVPAPDANRLYFVFLPPNVGSQYDQANSFVGHHGAFYDYLSFTPVYYAVIPHPIGNPQGSSLGGLTPFQQQTEISSHELAEAITDPDLSGGWYDSNGNEIGDLVNQQYGVLNGYIVQKEWSNLNNAGILPAGGTSYQPQGGWVSSVTSTNGDLFGIGANNLVWWKWQTGTDSWSSWQYLGGPVWYVYVPPSASGFGGGFVKRSGVKSILATTDSNGQDELFAIGLNNELYTLGKTWQSAGYYAWQTSWQDLGGHASQIAVCRSGLNQYGRLDLFAIGSNKQIFLKEQTGLGPSGWDNSSWSNLGPYEQQFLSVSSMVVDKDLYGREQIFAISQMGNWVNRIEENGDGSWGYWQNLGLQAQSIAESSTADGRNELFAIGMDNAVWTIRQSAPGDWSSSSWFSLGGVVKSIAVARNADGREEVFAIGTDNAIWSLAQTAPNDSWTDSQWFSLGGQAQAVTVFSSGSLLDVAAIAMDNSLWTAQQSGLNGGWN